MFLLNEFRVSISFYSGLRSPGRSLNSTYFWNDSWVQTFHILRCLGNFDQMRGPIHFIEFLTVSNLGSSKSLFRKLYWVFFKLNKSDMFTVTRLCLTLNVKVAMSCRRRFRLYKRSVVWRGLAVLDRTLIWFCTPLLAVTIVCFWKLAHWQTSFISSSTFWRYLSSGGIFLPFLAFFCSFAGLVIEVDRCY